MGPRHRPSGPRHCRRPPDGVGGSGRALVAPPPDPASARPGPPPLPLWAGDGAHAAEQSSGYGELSRQSAELFSPLPQSVAKARCAGVSGVLGQHGVSGLPSPWWPGGRPRVPTWSGAMRARLPWHARGARSRGSVPRAYMRCLPGRRGVWAGARARLDQETTSSRRSVLAQGKSELLLHANLRCLPCGFRCAHPSQPTYNPHPHIMLAGST